MAGLEVTSGSSPLSTNEGIELERRHADWAVRDTSFTGPDGETYPSVGAFLFKTDLDTVVSNPEIRDQWEAVRDLPVDVDFAEEYES